MRAALVRAQINAEDPGQAHLLSNSTLYSNSVVAIATAAEATAICSMSLGPGAAMMLRLLLDLSGARKSMWPSLLLVCAKAMGARMQSVEIFALVPPAAGHGQQSLHSSPHNNHRHSVNKISSPANTGGLIEHGGHGWALRPWAWPWQHRQPPKGLLQSPCIMFHPVLRKQDAC